MDLTASLEAPCSPGELFAWVDDLARYPAWLSIVPRAEAAPADTASPGDPGPAWHVDLRGRLGPFARSKRLRMVRTHHDTPSKARFERRELDGRHHAPWVLDASVAPTPAGCRLDMRLHYGGGLWLPVIERILRDEIDGSRARLLTHVSG